ncbi:MAG: S8 family serine peptidase, partial [Bacteroidales bacterium]|nr:S8 family serine peptidase [Bacteroidales bacterium]
SRTFPDAGVFEVRSRKAGLHLWYDVTFDMPLTKAGAAMSDIPGVDLVEYRPKLVKPYSSGVVLASDYPVRGKDMPFDDPRLSFQWHYNNPGSLQSSRSGCDVDVFQAWKRYTVGDPKVIVAVVDGGVDFRHEDLFANMWRDPNYPNDTVVGYNFAKGTKDVDASDHGTHVAGTIAAVNNNGKGLCGIAGGDAKAGKPGVRMMSCQIFGEDDRHGSSDMAIKWAADHGAVICQNSWGFEDLTYLPTSTKQAIDYFIENAGFDENGNQTGPMAGGLLIFSAGNEGKGDAHYPSDYERVISVGALAANYQLAYYSNYGPGVDLLAPGGDSKDKNNVYSTLPHNDYGQMQGTSMACPHVSGVAALLLSYYGGPGFTPDRLRSLIEDGLFDISPYNQRPNIAKGLVSATLSIGRQSTIAPEKTIIEQGVARANNVDIHIVMPADEDDRYPAKMTLYYSKEQIEDVSKADSLVFDVTLSDVGNKEVLTVEKLDFDQTYYFAVGSEDFAGNRSELSDELEVRTQLNNAPVITADYSGSWTMHAHESHTIKFDVYDPDGHEFDFDLVRAPEWVTIARSQKGNELRVDATKCKEGGAFDIAIVATDYYGATTFYDILFTVLPNHSPQVLSQIDNICFNNKGSVHYGVASLFKDEDGEEVTCSYEFDNKIVAVSRTGDDIYIAALKEGTTQVSIIATDALDEKAVISFTVVVRDGTQEADFYPNPVKDVLNVRLGENMESEVMLFSQSGATVFTSQGSCGPFNPIKIDMSSMAAGNYTALIRAGGKEIKKTIVKL